MRSSSSSCGSHVAVVDIEQQRAGGVAGIGQVAFAPGQVPDEPGIDRAEGQLSRLGSCPGAGHMVEQPGELGAGEIGVQHQPGLGAEGRLMPLAPQQVALARGAPVLPDDGMVDRPAGRAVPDHGGFPLVGDADGGDIGGGHAGPGNRLHRHAELRGPDLLGVVLHQAGRGEELAEFLLGEAADRAVMVEHQGAGTGCSLVKGKDEAHCS